MINQVRIFIIMPKDLVNHQVYNQLTNNVLIKLQSIHSSLSLLFHVCFHQSAPDLVHYFPPGHRVITDRWSMSCWACNGRVARTRSRSAISRADSKSSPVMADCWGHLRALDEEPTRIYRKPHLDHLSLWPEHLLRPLSNSTFQHPQIKPSVLALMTHSPSPDSKCYGWWPTPHPPGHWPSTQRVTWDARCLSCPNHPYFCRMV